MLRFLGFYTLLMATAYSVIPYKTPWCLLGFLHGMVLLAGIGAVRLLHAFRIDPDQTDAGSCVPRRRDGASRLAGLGREFSLRGRSP